MYTIPSREEYSFSSPDKVTRGYAMVRLGFGLVLLLAAAPALGQEAPPKKLNELVAGKLVYVAPMPSNLDQWILDFLRRWGKYKVTGDPEGVDLVIKANKPEKDTELVMRGGVPQPRDERRRLPAPVPRKEHQEVPVISISVINWVTNAPLWHADILDRKQKKDEPDPASGPHTKIFARGMTPDQLAMKVTRTLQAYVGELEKTSQLKQDPEDSKQ